MISPRPLPQPQSGEFDGIVGAPVDGSEEARLDVLYSIQHSTSLDRARLSGRLRHEILERCSAREESQFFSADTPVVTDLQFPAVPSIYTSWLPKVSRFSFDVGRALDAQMQ